ncbi:hypothetical protein TNCV_5023901 [Trichonephila clavipes]|nr:hypothetical protein TNCV_5023901 [Trichonephila clavipes]
MRDEERAFSVEGVRPSSLLFQPLANDFDRCGPWKKHFGSQHFRTDAKIERVVVTGLYNLDTDFCYDVSMSWCTDEYMPR